MLLGRWRNDCRAWCDYCAGLPGVRGCRLRSRPVIVGFEHLEPSQLLIEDRERLELLRFCHLLLEPSLDLVLFHLFQIGVIIIDVSAKRSGVVGIGDADMRGAYLPVQLEKCHLITLAMHISFETIMHTPSHHYISGRPSLSLPQLPPGKLHARQERRVL